MSVLRSLESKIAGLVEGTFSRAFRSEVRPVEIARKLAREMESHRSMSVARTYVPNEYRVFLSPRDRARFAEYESALVGELAGYLLEHARREGLSLLSRPVIEFETDERLRLGEFGIQTRVVDPQEPDRAREWARESERAGEPWAREPSPQRRADDRYPDDRDRYAEERHPGDRYPDDPDAHEPYVPEPQPPARRSAPAPYAAEPHPADGATLVHGATPRRQPAPVPARERVPTAVLRVEGRRRVIGPRGATIGRSRQCDVVLSDSNVSRQHAELRPRGGAWVLTDLGSTNGSTVNGREITGPEVLKAGDRIALGGFELGFDLE